MKCPKCNTEMHSEVKPTYPVDFSADVVFYNVEVRICPSCGDCYTGVPTVWPQYRRMAKELAAKPRTLTPSEIKFLRKHLFWSEQDFDTVLGLPEQTCAQVEAGVACLSEAAEQRLRCKILGSSDHLVLPTGTVL